MTFTITYRTTDNEIEKATRSELLDLVVGTWGSMPRTAKKEELVDGAKEYRNRLKKVYDDKEAEKVAMRVAALHVEQEAGVVSKVMENLSIGLCNLMASRKKVLDDFRAKVQATAEDKDTICSILSWRAEEVMKAETELGVLRTLNGFATKQAAVQAYLLIQGERKMTRCSTKTSYGQCKCLWCNRPASTDCPVTSEIRSSLKSFVESSGRAWKANLLESWTHGGDHGPELQNLRNIIGPSGLAKLQTSRILRWNAA